MGALPLAVDRADQLVLNMAAIDGNVVFLMRKPALIRARVAPTGKKHSMRRKLKRGPGETAASF